MFQNKRILFAILNWGLGHATRSIPLIKKLLQESNQVVIASDGVALKFLQQEFPNLEFEYLPTYNIHYSRSGFLLPVKMLIQTPKILKTISKENQITSKIVKKHKVDLIISDNRYGVYHNDIYSVFMTHQLRVFSGITTWLTTKFQHRLIRNFDEVFVPDFEGDKNLSGRLSHDINIDKKITYLGILSRFNHKNIEKKYDILAILSGPEPQRSILEKIILTELAKSDKKIGIVRGVVEDIQTVKNIGNIDVYNYLLSNELEEMINSSELIIARSGYSTVMDLYQLNKRAIYIPTPGQTEQIYLAKYLQKKGLARYVKQNEFNFYTVNF